MSLPRQPYFSIIVPVYQVEDYLNECLGSIIAQAFDDFEVVCVDDGSTDRSAEILDGYAAADPRIRVVHQLNSGLSAARNRGLDLARGRYVMFVDSDDLIVPEACQVLYQALMDNAADIITFGASLYPPPATDAYLQRILSPRDIIYNGFQPELLFLENSQPYVWRSAFNTGFVKENGLRFNQSVSYGEDVVFYFQAYPLSISTRLISNKLYCYRVNRSGSLMQSNAKTTKRIDQHIQIVEHNLKNWDGMQLLPKYAAWFWEWALELLVYDIATSQADQAWLMQRLCQTIAPYLDKDMLVSLALTRPSKSILRTVLAAQYNARPKISWLQLQSYRLSRKVRLFGASR
ncbi:MAG: glycosyltransferase [Coriobacteriia bacterium]|nr:glycosyltransferase [Coriobacteriia bacterium]